MTTIDGKRRNHCQYAFRDSIIAKKEGYGPMKKYLLVLIMSWFIFYSAADAKLVDNGDGTVTDTNTGLMWQQDEAGTMTWTEALSYCENLQLANYADWRLPNRNELQSLIDYSKHDPAIDTVAFPDVTSSDYWSSTTYVNNSVFAWIVYFGSGGVGYVVNQQIILDGVYTFYRLNVRAVRGGE
jgi:hypothetical protein